MKSLTLRFAPILCLVAASFAAQAEIILSEFMADNDSTLADRDGEFSDWIEVHNSILACACRLELSLHLADQCAWSRRLALLSAANPAMTLTASKL